MTFLSSSQRQRASAPNGSLMKTPDHIEALLYRDLKPFGWKQAAEQEARLKLDKERKAEALGRIEQERAKLIKQHAEAKRRVKIERYEAVMRRDSKYLDDLRKRGPENSGRPLPGEFDFLCKLTSDLTGFAVEDLLGKSRKRDLTWTRHALIRMTRLNWHGLSLPDIGRKFNMDHTSVLFALRGCQKKAPYNAQKEEIVEGIIDQVTQLLCELDKLSQKQTGGE